MGLLLLPVFLYLLLSIPMRPATVVPNEYKKSITTYFSDSTLFNDKVTLMFFPNKENQYLALEKIIWFDQLFDDKFSCYQLLVSPSDSVFTETDIEYNQLSSYVHVIDNLEKDLVPMLKSYKEDHDVFIMIDEEGQLRGVFNMDDDKEQVAAKTELFILLQNSKKCLKKY